MTLAIPLCHWGPATPSAGEGGGPGVGASQQLLQDPSILPGSLFSPSSEQALPRNRACGCSCHAGRHSLWTPSQIHRTENQLSSFVPHGRAATCVPVEIQSNFIFAYERTRDVSWGEDVQETWMEAFAGAILASFPTASSSSIGEKKPRCSGCCLLATLCGAAQRGPLHALPWL